MLYHLYDWHHAILSPSRVFAETLQHVFSHPLLPISYTRLGRAIAAGSEIYERSTRRYKKPEFGLHHTTIDGESVAVELETVTRRPFCDLLHFRRDTRKKDPKVLLVAPLSGHYATLLRGTAQGLLPQHDVYITDWVNACQVPIEKGRFDLDDYIDYVIDFLRLLGPDVHVIAVCQPSVPVLAAVSIMSAENDPCVPRSMTLMGGPIDTRVNPTQVNRLAATRSIEWFEHTVITTVPATYPGFMRRVYPGFLQLTGFMTMNLDRHFGSTVRHFQHLVRGDGDSAASHRKFYDEYLSVMDLTAEFYLQTVKTAFQDHALPLGTMISRGRKVDPRAIRKTALMTVEGELDDISGVGQTFAAHGLCSSLPPSKRKHHLQKQVGHFGIFNGKRWRGEILPQVAAFIRENSGQSMKRAG
jgi:poly(3-hydroxybutyrate) depolymerase